MNEAFIKMSACGYNAYGRRKKMSNNTFEKAILLLAQAVEMLKENSTTTDVKNVVATVDTVSTSESVSASILKNIANA